jgi:purine nucleosidase
MPRGHVLLAGVLVLGMSAGALVAQKPIPVIFDTDIGDDIDDALALALALQSPELDVRAVTTVVDDTESRTRLAWKELGLYNRHDVVVATGAPEPLLDARRNDPAPQFTVLTPQDTAPPSARRRAADLIVDTLMASSEKLTLVPVGPLTNIGLALRLEPRIREKVERIVLMGGAFGMLHPEYNIQRDRAAAQIVFSSGVPITAVGLDVTMKCKLQGKDLDRLRAADNPASRFLMRLIELWQGGHTEEFPTLHDPLAVAVAFRPGLVETQLGSVAVETASPLTYGMTIFTAADPSRGKDTTQVARQVDVRKFLDMFIERLSSSPRGK